jgi:hypothetical protein
MVRVPPNGEGKNDHPWGEVADLLDYHPPRFLGILQVGIGQPRVPAFCHPEQTRSPFCFLCAE